MIFARSGAESFGRTDHLFSPRLGLVLKPSSRPFDLCELQPLLSAAVGRPVQRAHLDHRSALKPERFDNYEVGAKLQLPGGLLATAAIYQLERSNTRATDPLDPANIVLTGKQRSRGLELGLERSITSRWLISAGYTLQKAEITQTTSAAPAGSKAPLVPRHSFSLWSRL